MNKLKGAFIVFSELVDLKTYEPHNWWHSRDHMPENLALPGIPYAERGFASPEYMSARLVADPVVSQTQYVTCYYTTEPVEEIAEEFSEGLPKRLQTLGRILSSVPRKNPLGGGFIFVKGYAAPRIEISTEAVPYRPHKGLFVTVADILDDSQKDTIAQWYDRVRLPDMLTVKGVTGIYWFTGKPMPYGEGVYVEGTPPGRFIHLYYLDSEPLEMLADLKAKEQQWRAEGRVMDISKSLRPILSGPYKTLYPFQVGF